VILKDYHCTVSFYLIGIAVISGELVECNLVEQNKID